jgi:hypothetical protein
MKWYGMEWPGLVQDRRGGESSCELGNVPSGSIKCWKFFSRSTTGCLSSSVWLRI